LDDKGDGFVEGRCVAIAKSHEGLAGETEKHDIAVPTRCVLQGGDAGNFGVREDGAVEARGFRDVFPEPEVRDDVRVMEWHGREWIAFQPGGYFSNLGTAGFMKSQLCASLVQ